MGCLAIMRCTDKSLISDTPIVDGQFFIEAEQYSENAFNKMYMDNDNVRREIGITSWFGISSKPFESINDDDLVVIGQSPTRTLVTLGQRWSQLQNKPFEEIGSTLSVKNGALTFAYKWDEIVNKPFYTIGYGLNVDSEGYLNADVPSVGLSQIGSASSSNISYQALTVGNVNSEIIGTKYMEYSQLLSTTNNTIYTFNNSDINSNTMIEVYTSIWGVIPISIVVTNGRCVVTFPKYDTSANLRCRIYIL